MRQLMFYIAIVFAGLTLGTPVTAQDQPEPAAPAKASEPEHFYKLTFVVQELNADGKPVNGRSYTTTVSTKPNSRESIRTGARVPVPTASSNQAAATVLSQYQYMDVGVNFDIHDVREAGRDLAFSVRAEVTSLASSTDARLTQPVIRQNLWDSQALLAVGKATPVFTSDAIDNKGSLQVVATVTRLE